MAIGVRMVKEFRIQTGIGTKRCRKKIKIYLDRNESQNRNRDFGLWDKDRNESQKESDFFFSRE